MGSCIIPAAWLLNYSIAFSPKEGTPGGVRLVVAHQDVFITQILHGTKYPVWAPGPQLVISSGPLLGALGWMKPLNSGEE